MNISELCELVYSVPNPWATLEQHERHEHRDLKRQSHPELRRELERLKLRLLLDDAPDPWLFARLDLLRRVISDAR